VTSPRSLASGERIASPTVRSCPQGTPAPRIRDCHPGPRIALLAGEFGRARSHTFGGSQIVSINHLRHQALENFVVAAVDVESTILRLKYAGYAQGNQK